jgi:2-[(L-alanin-3-ylcarbamoyl)methyl]-3-(2-aminoethylcarbamoyl)-2-hydroxypropanoate synthase
MNFSAKTLIEPSSARLFYTEEYTQSRRRLFKQLIQAFVYEDTIKYEEKKLSTGLVEFSVQGIAKNGQPVIYSCKGHRRASFGRVELNAEPVLRTCSSQVGEAASVREFLSEIAPSFAIAAEFMERFIQELDHTLANDTAALFYANQQNVYAADNQGIGLLRGMPYDYIESGLLKTHPYHPCYKSRIGFDAVDNLHYGPEFSPDIKLVWLAVRKLNCLSIASPSLNEWDFYQQQLGDQLIQFNALLTEHGCDVGDYVFMPVHPWQWLNQLLPLYTADIHQRNIILLGEGLEAYRPQQSIRTLANAVRPDVHYTKLALNIVNTSTARGLAEHTIANAPIISDWLHRLVAEDNYLAKELNTIILKEVKAISYSSACEAIASGKIACLWRESLHPYLTGDEQAIPFSGLTEMDRDALPVIQNWVVRYGVQDWLVQLLKVSVLPLIRLLYAHGVALESHAQNMILIHKDGWPIRVAFKDFHDGVRFIQDQVTYSECLTILRATPQQHLAVNSSSYISASEPEDVKNFLYSAFFSMNLSEVALFFDLHYQVPESLFWNLVKDCIMGYQREFPEQHKQFQLFNLQSEYVIVEAHTKRRLQNESSVRINRVKNPLFSESQFISSQPIMEASYHE